MHFIDVMFPPAEVGVQFVDLNKSLERLIGFPPASEIRDPWRRALPTITSNSKMILRDAKQDGGISIRCVHPVELMRVVGWDLSHWHTEFEAMDHGLRGETLISLAGNAFSAFALAPLLVASLSALGLYAVASEALPAAQIDVHSSGSES